MKDVPFGRIRFPLAIVCTSSLSLLSTPHKNYGNISLTQEVVKFLGTGTFLRHHAANKKGTGECTDHVIKF
jgi:hypothetical protein